MFIVKQSILLGVRTLRCVWNRIGLLLLRNYGISLCSQQFRCSELCVFIIAENVVIVLKIKLSKISLGLMVIAAPVVNGVVLFSLNTAALLYFCVINSVTGSLCTSSAAGGHESFRCIRYYIITVR